ncbi:MAG: DUF1549 domain-containing protein [Planctomycetes bacterium]|nr:DUF1549 domain-containing protein [Planctomycetota bacterium]
MNRILSIALGAAALSIPAYGADIVKPASQRFADPDLKEVPSLQRHVLPLMGRLGCNGRACHGSFQGQGGLRLSLFGYDFKADYEALTKADKGRVDTEVPEDSLILQKPTLGTPHKGGKRLELDSWQYHIIKKWVEAGAKAVGDDDPHFVWLEVTPTEIVFKKPGDTAQIKVIAHWSDGTAEDVTPLCRYRTNDESLAEIDADGRVKSLGNGDTHVVAFYDNGVVPTQIILPVSDKVGKKYPKVPTPTKIDELVVTKLRKLGIVPSKLADDTEFLRRVSLDITGTLPSPQEITAFLDDKAPDKRAKKIDELLQRPAYAAWMTTLLCDQTGNNSRLLNGFQQGNNYNQQASEQWYGWLHRRVKENMPYDKLIAGIVLATSRLPGQSYEDYLKDMRAYFSDAKAENHKDATERDTMPYFWVKQNLRKPDDAALQFAYTFLGVRLQCSQCHKHPFDQWTQHDFQQFAAFFNRVQYNVAPDGRKLNNELQEKLGLRDREKNQQQRQVIIREAIAKGEIAPWNEVFIQPASNPGRGGAQPDKGRRPQNQRTITPKVLGGDEVVEQLDDPRKAIMDWMLEKDNPYFARSFVNRTWARFFGVGIIEPADDMNLANPPANAELLDSLADGFVEHGYDMKWLQREICNSRTYQLTWQPNETNKYDTRNFSHANVRRLPAEVAYDAILLATASADQIKKLHEDPSPRAIADQRSNARQGKGNQQQYALRAFGQPERATTCDCERSMEPSLTQSLYLMNDSELFNLMDRKDGRLAELGRKVAEASKPAGRDKQNAKGDQRNPKQLAERIKEAERRIQQLKDEGKTDEAGGIERKLAGVRDELRALEEKASREPEAAKPAPAASLNTDELVREMYLRTLSRFPNDSEMSKTREYLTDAKDPVIGVRDVLWALLNTKEFIVNH